MSDTLDQWHYFVTPVYSIKKLEFLGAAKVACNEMLNLGRGKHRENKIYPVLQVDVSSDKRLTPFLDYTLNTGWNLLRDQGYAMDNFTTHFTEAWCQEHDKYSSMECHTHSDSKLIAFYFVECPNDPPRLVIHDPRPGKIMADFVETDSNKLSLMSPAVNFIPEPGMLMFANSWLPHSFTRNSSNKPFKLIHMNITIKRHSQANSTAPKAEII